MNLIKNRSLSKKIMINLGFWLLLSNIKMIYAVQLMYRDFWQPQMRQLPLAACFLNKTGCGKPVATAYCQTMGYEKVVNFKMAYNVGLTHYFDQTAKCQGWQCDAFSLIQCAKAFSDHNKDYQYSFKTFYYPRYANHRVAWCNSKKSCGRVAAYAFCRRMGYANVKNYQRAFPVADTRSIGTGRLCYGDECQGFQKISCMR